MSVRNAGIKWNTYIKWESEKRGIGLIIKDAMKKYLQEQSEDSTKIELMRIKLNNYL